MNQFQVTSDGFFGRYGGTYIPEILYPCVQKLQQTYRSILEDKDFLQEFHALLRDYVGRPSPLYLSPALSKLHNCKIYLKEKT